MRKDTTPPNMLFDRRVVERNIRKGVVTREDYNQWLSALSDVAENAETVRTTLGEDDDLDDDFDDEDDAN